MKEKPLYYCLFIDQGEFYGPKEELEEICFRYNIKHRSITKGHYPSDTKRLILCLTDSYLTETNRVSQIKRIICKHWKLPVDLPVEKVIEFLRLDDFRRAVFQNKYR